MVSLIGKLHHTGLLTIEGALRLLEAILTTGVNLMAMLRVAAKMHPHRTAVIDERGRLTYAELWRQAESLAVALSVRRGVRSGHKVAIACGNHMAAVKVLFAVSRLGAHVYLVNPESSPGQILALEEGLRFDLYVTTSGPKACSRVRRWRQNPSPPTTRPAIRSTGWRRRPAAGGRVCTRSRRGTS
jgi:fatty-acyl-CoA synthase